MSATRRIASFTSASSGVKRIQPLGAASIFAGRGRQIEPHAEDGRYDLGIGRVSRFRERIPFAYLAALARARQCRPLFTFIRLPRRRKGMPLRSIEPPENRRCTSIFEFSASGTPNARFHK